MLEPVEEGVAMAPLVGHAHLYTFPLFPRRKGEGVPAPPEPYVGAGELLS